MVRDLLVESAATEEELWMEVSKTLEVWKESDKNGTQEAFKNLLRAEVVLIIQAELYWHWDVQI